MVSKITITLVDDEGEEVEHDLPSKWEVCPRCDGAGTHVNPSIDGHGLSREDFDADPDFEESYFSGVYDAPCYTCKGRTTVQVVDDEALTTEQRAVYEKHQAIERDRRADYASERSLRMAEGWCR